MSCFVIAPLKVQNHLVAEVLSQLYTQYPFVNHTVALICHECKQSYSFANHREPHFTISLIKPTNSLFFKGQQPIVGQDLAHYWGFTITPRHTTLGRTPLDEWSATCIDLYLTTHNTQQQTHIHAHGGIQTHDPSKRTAADPHLGPSGHWDRQQAHFIVYIQCHTHSVQSFLDTGFIFIYCTKQVFSFLHVSATHCSHHQWATIL
jgi:hypothetical protein